MFASYYLGVFAVVSLFGSSIEQQPFQYTDGYRSSCKFHQEGTVNLIISAPHGGKITPKDVPDRNSGGCRRRTGPNAGICTWFYDDRCGDGEKCTATTVMDTLSDEFAENVVQELSDKWSLNPYVVIGKWSRKKVDFNREINEATLNYPEAILAYQSYHSNIQLALDDIDQKFGKGLLLDIHGHGYGDYTMVGYLLTGNELNRNNLSGPALYTSIESLCKPDREECVRGRTSFGTFLELSGLGVAYPSLANPKPGSKEFFSGGYITSNYISKINAIQTELPYYIRTDADRLTYAKNYAKVVVDYMKANNLLLSN